MSKKVLMVAFHFPPDASIGVQRALKTAELIPDFGWEPYILTAKPSAYASFESTQTVSDSLLKRTYRTPALDVYTHLSIKGKYFEWMATIDRWTSWVPGALLKGRSIIRQYKPNIIWSTSPIPSAHIVANNLARYADIPWVADFRDPFSFHHYPTKQFKAKVLGKIDRSTIQNCHKAVFTSLQTRDLYAKAYPEQPDDKFCVVENGYDEANWLQIEETVDPECKALFDPKKFSMLYSGVLYPNGRDPTNLFLALQALQAQNSVSPENFELVFQGAGTGEAFDHLINDLGIQNLVRFTPSVSYLHSLRHIKNADALVLIQDEVFNLQVPGKLYEYIRSGRPVLALTPRDSATADVARRYDGGFQAFTKEEIEHSIKGLIESPATSDRKQNVTNFSRTSRTRQFADLFDKII